MRIGSDFHEPELAGQFTVSTRQSLFGGLAVVTASRHLSVAMSKSRRATFRFSGRTFAQLLHNVGASTGAGDRLLSSPIIG